jgi:hypothetical protein
MFSIEVIAVNLYIFAYVSLYIDVFVMHANAQRQEIRQVSALNHYLKSMLQESMFHFNCCKDDRHFSSVSTK